MSQCWVGSDPGEKGTFGLAFVDVSGRVCSAMVSSVDEAVKKITAVGELLALGIDAPMWWPACEGRAAWRTQTPKAFRHPERDRPVRKLLEGRRAHRRHVAGFADQREIPRHPHHGVSPQDTAGCDGSRRSAIRRPVWHRDGLAQRARTRCRRRRHLCKGELRRSLAYRSR